jgi:NADH-quinone oxidoreductase subunit K
MMKYFYCSFGLFTMGSVGLFYLHRHILTILISFELILLAINMNFAIFSVYFDDLLGQVTVLFILTVVAAETALGLAIVIIYYRLRGGLSLEFVKLLKG